MVQEFIRTMRKKTVQHRLWLVLVLGILGSGAIAFQSFFSFIQIGHAETMATVAKLADTEKQRTEAFSQVVLEARGGYVLDLTTNVVLFSKNSEEVLPLASVTKLMTTFVAAENMSNSVVVSLTKDDLSTEGDSGLRVGERWRMGDLLDVMLVISSNDAAHAIAGLVGGAGQQNVLGSHEHFIEMMNEKARTLGLATLKFYNESGLDLEQGGVSIMAGGYGSAKDVALLVAELWKKYPTTLEITTRKDVRIVSQDGIAHILPNTNEALGQYPGMIGSKTGYTSLAGGNLAIIFDIGIGHPVVAVILGSTREGRFSDMRALTQATLKAFE